MIGRFGGHKVLQRSVHGDLRATEPTTWFVGAGLTHDSEKVAGFFRRQSLFSQIHARSAKNESICPYAFDAQLSAQPSNLWKLSKFNRLAVNEMSGADSCSHEMLYRGLATECRAFSMPFAFRH